MPIYTYKCGACGHVKDVLQKISDPTTLTVCPDCGAHSFSKQVSAASFHLKGSGWYVTDFRDKSNQAGNQAEPAAEANKENNNPGVKSEEQGKNKTQAQSDTTSPASDKVKDNSTSKVAPAATSASTTTSP